MTKPTVDELRAFLNLKRTNETMYEILVGWFRRDNNEERERAVNEPDDVKQRWAAGRAQQTAFQLKYIGNPEGELGKLKQT